MTSKGCLKRFGVQKELTLIHLISFMIVESRVAFASRTSQTRASTTFPLFLQEDVSKLQSQTDGDESQNQVHPAYRHRPGG